MAAEEIPAWVSCAQCEIASATLECIDEELLYCAPCSASLHSKRARLHHSVKPFQTCDECEAAVARVRCASCAGRQSEPLVFCVDCSALLHSKKARHHHQVESISSSCKQEGVLRNECKDEKTGETIHTKAEAATFIQTEDAIASGQDATQGVCMRVTPPSCQQRFPLSREEEGHSKQGPSQSSKQDSLLSNTRDASTQANTLTDKTPLIISSNAHNTQKAALNTTEDDALLNTKDSPLQGEVPLINASQAVGIVDRLDVCNEGKKKEVTLTETEPVLEAVLTRTEVDGIAFMKKSAPTNMQEATKEEVSLTPTEMAYVLQKAPLSSISGVASECTQEAISNRGHDALLGSAEGVPTSNMGNVAPTIVQQEASVSTKQHNSPFSRVEEAAKITMVNASKEAQLVGGRPGMQQSLSEIHFAQPPFQSDHMQLTPDCHHPHSHFHTQSPCQGQYQGPHTPPPFQSHLFPHCTPLIPRHMAGSTWPVRAMDFSPNAFHGNQYSAGFMTPACQSYALVSPPGYMPYSNPCYTGFFPQVDHSSSAYTPQRLYEHNQPIFPHENSDSIHSKSNDRQGPGSNKRLRSNLCEVNPMPTCDKGGEDFTGNLSKKMHTGEGPTRANSPNLVNGEDTARTLPKKVHGDSLPEESSKKVEETCTQDTSSLEKGHTSSSPGEAISEKDSEGKSFEKALPVKEAPCDELQKASPSIVNEVLPERPHGKDFMPEVLLEKVSTTETCGKVSETETAPCSSSAASEQPPNVLTPGMQLDDCLLLRTPIIDMPVKSVPMANGPPGEVSNEKLAVESMSNEVQPPPGIALDNCIPLKKPSTGLVDKVIPVARVPIGEVQNEKLVSESLSSEVLSEMVPAGTLPARAPSKVTLANLLPKEEPVDLMPGGDELSEFADMFVAGKDSPRISFEINPKEECAFHESNVAHKYPTKRLTKVSVKRSLQVTQSPLPDMSKEEENSRESSEPSYSEGDTSADDETFNTKKYRRGTITLEATVMKRNVYDALNAVTERIRTNLKRGLRCSTSDDDAREALKNAQRQLTKYNLKQASAFEGCLQNSQALKTGSCVVEFVRTGSSQRGRLDYWTYNLAQTVAKYFATDFCAQRLNVVFYGITQNAYCAAHAFAATYNRIAAFSADYIPEKLLDEGDLVEMDRNWECPNKGVFSRKSRLAYKNDLVEVLFNIPKWQRERRAVKAEKVETGDGVAHVPIHSVWMEGVPKNASLVKKHGYKTMEALTMHCRKACKAFIENNNWTIVASKLKDPILW